MDRTVSYLENRTVAGVSAIFGMDMNALEKRLADAAKMGPEYAESAKQYLARIGSIGGKKSRRKLSKKEASRIAKLRWAKKATPSAQ